jgi:two-component system, NarL family, sensor histidine kinase DesK
VALRDEGLLRAPSRPDPIPGWLALGVGVGLVAFMIRPALALAQEPATGPYEYLAVGSLVAFIGVYFWAGPIAFVRRAGGRPSLAAAVLGTLAFAISLIGRDANWTILFVAVAVVAGAITPWQRAFAAIVLTAVLATLARVVATGAAVGIVESAFAVVISGLVVVSFGRLDRTARELTLAQAEVARLAAADERAKIARDVHDLIGHSLSVIALKSELARRLVDTDSGRASAELQDIEGVARGSLRDIRETVAGYRLITLDTELAGARMALSAAGIVMEVHQTTDVQDPATEALLGWVVREGITNVIRHSNGAHCTIRIKAVADQVQLEIIDDGRGHDRHGSGLARLPGSGLSGLQERLRAAGGRLEAGPAPGRGYRLEAVVPDRTGPRAPSPAADERDPMEAGGDEDRDVQRPGTASAASGFPKGGPA